MRVTIIQNKVCKSIDETLKRIDDLLRKKGIVYSDFIVLPEMFTTPYDIKAFSQYKQSAKGQVVGYLKLLSRRMRSYVIGGSIPFEENGKLYNTTFVFNREGHLINRYDKIQLFEITYPDKTHFNEGDVFSAGETLGLFETEYGIMGQMICFDIRYPMIAHELMKKGAKIIFVPAAFNTYTGPLHWQTTFKARAIDNQLFTIGASPSSDSYGSYNTYGHSIIVDPLGRIIQELGDQEDLIVVDLDLREIEKTREALPIVKNMK